MCIQYIQPLKYIIYITRTLDIFKTNDTRDYKQIKLVSLFKQIKIHPSPDPGIASHRRF